ncbi:beta-N-acetylglucosaminidase domain-containing protein [Salinibacterium sp. NG253]|uniref:protein O-GlcNAcase n=1 Tax=Salinibacterium sp. NG253 TaxID=2792039 RepID=UPI0018CDC293|nr:protein O-GlcNAcase [Salinibacterium sp. NG253]MBH0116860.1 beta-N-acetylglucosaminidase domain-containing protein [Salinibacterium sp. NG253]
MTPRSRAISDSSAFAIRGVIEGFYGAPWSHEQRLDLISFLGNRGMNTFVYSPKDDPLVRHEWRTPYAGTELARMAELITRCDDNDLTFMYCLSPGLTMKYSSNDDIEMLLAKFSAVRELGVTNFGLLLDDIPARLQHPADVAAFPDLVTAHQSLIGNVFSQFDADTHLTVCPTQYWGYGDEDYITRLGRGIDPRIDLFWTGRAICSATLDLADAAVFARSTGRPATYWDNYPVNDVAMGHELHIGPYQGRDPQLHRFSTGIIANGMELFESSKIPFATIADYLRDPENYDPEASWKQALLDVVGQDNLDDFSLFADTVRSSCLSADDAPVLGEALERFTFESEYGDAATAAANLLAVAHTMLGAADRLLDGPVANPQLIAEVRPWLESFRVGARALVEVAELAAAGRLSTAGPSRLLPYLDTLRAARRRVFGDLLDMTLAELVSAGGSPPATPASPRTASPDTASPTAKE